MKIKTSELQGAQLDWAVAKCEGYDYNADNGLLYKDKEPHFFNSYSADWSEGGPIIERERICVKSNLMRDHKYPEHDWYADCPEVGFCVSVPGPTPLVAAMRCYVASKLGDKIDVPYLTGLLYKRFAEDEV